MVVAATMASMDDHERKIVVEFCQLLEQSKQLFNGLRDLPQCGQKIWQGYFGKTFDVYTKLWKFQQQHRQVLDTKYGLKRWQIGEIASKIGQLYYHYYLRTSDTNNLNEAYSFYSAIRGRQYYSRVSQEDRSDLMVKKLRYYARFIVVCLLLRRVGAIRELLAELDKQIVDYTSTYEPDDQLEWSLVLEEIKTFVKADSIVNVLHADQSNVTLSHRLTPLSTPPVEKSTMMNLSLQEIILIGNASEQVKFSEMTIDMFRMMQTLEREKNRDETNHVSDPPSRASFEKSYSITSNKTLAYPMMASHDVNNGRRENPHKYILYKPTITQIMMFLATGFKELPANGVLLMYVSADGCFQTSKHVNDLGYDCGGIMASSKREMELTNKKGMHVKEIHCLYPGDLYPFTRKPLFVIIDSDNSFAFQYIPRYFGHPFVVLMSPQELPDKLHEQLQHNGSLFTLFLHSPLTAFCLICNILTVKMHLWERANSYVDRFITEASRLFTSKVKPDVSYIQFFGDDFLRLLLLRYVFCHVVLRHHRAFNGEQYLPRCQPPLPLASFLEEISLKKYVKELAKHFDVSSHFENFE
ncbi:protein SCAI [Daktulosphaira vitifoliae]|uniref:protein SCAI n=1 Tax=Daktulosphaira vitifoliae TaxID=58002 RepID=UPI0021AA28F2|nr:protein SCAI [Daktulosphaira vitifoliae]